MGAEATTRRVAAADGSLAKAKLDVERAAEASEEMTPTTTASDSDHTDLLSDDDLEAIPAEEHLVEIAEEACPSAPRAGPPPPPSDTQGRGQSGSRACSRSTSPGSKAEREDDEEDMAPDGKFSAEETVFIFDWDDTVLPSTWVQRQGLRLDAGSEVKAWQREQLSEVANAAAETFRLAKQHGTVVLVTNAERGWIELSCQKFLPTLYPSLENVKLVSARTTYESPECSAPCDWKVRAFACEVRRIYGADVLAEPLKRKNMLSLGDSVHEREALLRATSPLPNCRSKSLKFVERPDVSQIIKQHSLITSSFNRIVHHDGNLDLCIRCA